MESYDWLFEDNSCVEKVDDEVKEVGEEPIWTTKDGKKIPLSKMSTMHITNCLKLLNLNKNQKWYKIFSEELEKRKTQPFRL
jgi:hypothetical protein